MEQSFRGKVEGMSKFIWESQRKLHPKIIGLSGELKV